MIPIIGGEVTVLSGSKGVGDWSMRVYNYRKIVHCAHAYCVTGGIGRLGRDRPTRKGGPRVELLKISGAKFICHNYGHGGAG